MICTNDTTAFCCKSHSTRWRMFSIVPWSIVSAWLLSKKGKVSGSAPLAGSSTACIAGRLTTEKLLANCYQVSLFLFMIYYFCYIFFSYYQAHPLNYCLHIIFILEKLNQKQRSLTIYIQKKKSINEYNIIWNMFINNIYVRLQSNFLQIAIVFNQIYDNQFLCF